MERNKLIAFALNFASFLLEKMNVNAIILFGSVAKNQFDDESDIDLFIETENKNKDKINSILELYEKSKAKKVKIWRKIYGYRQRVGKKTYISKGMIEKRLGRGAFIVPIEDSQKVIDYLKSNKIKYLLSDIWTD